MKDRKPLTLTQWAMIAVSLFVVPLFAIVVWQLALLDPGTACAVVKAQGIPPGNHCFMLWTQAFHIKGWVIWGLIATLAAFILVLLSSLVKTAVSIIGPGGVQLNINNKKQDSESREETSVEVNPAEG